MKLEELEKKWARRAADWKTLRVWVSGDRVAAEILTDLRQLGASAIREEVRTRLGNMNRIDPADRNR